MKNNSRLWRLVLTLLLGSLLLSGCGGAEGATSQKAVEVPDTAYVEPMPFEAGWTLYTLEKDGVALSLPSSWQEFNLSEDDLQSVMGDMMAANPSFGSSMSGQIASMAAQGIKFYAFDSNSISLQSGFAENLNLVRTQRPSNIDLDSAIKESMSELRTKMGSMIDGPVMSMKLTTTSGHELGRLNYDAVFNMPGGSPLTLSLVQYIAVTNNDLFILTGTAPLSRFDDYDSIFEGVAQGMYFLPR
jgi:hypothetical protein